MNVPAITVAAIAEGLRAVGLDAQALLRKAGIPDDLSREGLLVPSSALDRLWALAFELTHREELAVEVGLVLPLGVFGVMDYLAASADTVAGAFQSLADHFESVASQRSIEIEERDGEYRVGFLVREDDAGRVCGDDFTVAVMVGRFRSVTERFPILVIELTRAAPARPERFAELLGASVSFGHNVAALRLPLTIRDVSLKSRDPLLRRTLESMAVRLSLGQAATPLEKAIRGRLRDLLPDGRAKVPRVARSLGMSERSLHRRLAAIGSSYQGVVDGFRRSEAERLLLAKRLSMAEIALALGFGDQSAFSRAFKRWTRVAPSDWLAQRAR